MFGVHNSSVANVKRGICERIFTVDYGEGLQPPIPQDVDEFRRCTEPAYVFLRDHAFTLRKWSYEEFINSYDTPQQRARYTKALESIRNEPVSRKDSDVKTFVKAEKVCFTCKADPAPRIISPRDPRYNIAVGVYVKAVEGVLYKLLDEMCGGRTVMKGLNSLQVGEAVADAWSVFDQPVAVGVDAKRFDQHTRTGALKYEQSIYKMFFTGDDRAELSRLLSWQLSSKCRAYLPDAVVKFTMDIRASGDMNTGLGTCVIACSLVHSYCHRVDLKYRLLNNGDDCVILVEREDLPKLDGFFDFCKRAGYWMEIEDPVDCIEEIVFCQTRPVLTGRGWTMVRDFPHSVAKDMVSLLPLTTETAWRKWANDVGNCGMAINSGVPVLWSVYCSLARAGQGTFGSHPWTRNSGFFRMARGLESTWTPITDEARLSFYRAFGVPPDQQEAIELHYDALVHELNPAGDGKAIYTQHTTLPQQQTFPLYCKYIDSFTDK